MRREASEGHGLDEQIHRRQHRDVNRARFVVTLTVYNRTIGARNTENGRFGSGM